MISPGKILYKYRHGVKTAYYRDKIRPRILETTLKRCLCDSQCEVHVYTSSEDFLNAIWSLKTFYHFSGTCYKLCIHHDGTLNKDDEACLREHFTDSRVVSAKDEEDQVLDKLRHFPRCTAFRKSNHLAPKVFDFFLGLQSGRMLVLDSDVLFFAKPQELLRRIEDPNYHHNSFNRDISSAYTLDDSGMEALGVDVQPRINSGLGLVQSESLNLPLIEKALGLIPEDAHFWRIEQTLHAVLSSAHGYEPLPEEYDVYNEGSLSKARPARHYVGMIRHLMYKEGMCRLTKEGFLERA